MLVYQGSRNWFLLGVEHFESAYKALYVLCTNTDLAWVNREIVATDLAGLLRACRWEVIERSNKDIIGLRFIGTQDGDDDLIFNAIAPFVRDGSYISMYTVLGSHFEFRFKDKKCVVMAPKTIMVETTLRTILESEYD